MQYRDALPFEIAGRVSVAFGGLEILLRFLSWMLIGARDSDAGQAVTHDLEFSELTELLFRLSGQPTMSVQRQRRCRRILAAAGRLAAERSTAFQNLAAIDTAGYSTMVHIRDALSLGPPAPPSDNELSDLERRCRMLARRVLRLMEDLAHEMRVPEDSPDTEMPI